MNNVIDLFEYQLARHRRDERRLQVSVDAYDGAVLLSLDDETYSLTPRAARGLARHIGLALRVLGEVSPES